MWCLVPWPGIEPRPPALGARSRSRWTAREAPGRSLSFLPGSLADFTSDRRSCWCGAHQLTTAKWLSNWHPDPGRSRASPHVPRSRGHPPCRSGVLCPQCPPQRHPCGLFPLCLPGGALCTYEKTRVQHLHTQAHTHSNMLACPLEHTHADRKSVV